MKSSESPINPWVRADLHTYNEETFQIVPDIQKPDYVRIMSDIAIRGAELDNAQARYQESLSERDAFFAGITGA